VLSEPTYEALSVEVDAERLKPALVKGRQAAVAAYRIAAAGPAAELAAVKTTVDR